MSDRHIRRLGQSYGDTFLTLLPHGQAWPRDPGTTLDLACRGLVDYWGFVDGRAADLLEQESDPRYTLELLPDWERNWGLPDPCYEAPQTIAERQAALLARMTMLGAQSREFYINLAAQIGYTITISEFRTFVVGMDRVGDARVYGDGSDPMMDAWNRPIKDPRGNNVALGELSDWPYYGLGPATNRFYWTVHVDDAKLTWFRCASGQCGVDPHLRIGTFDDLECILHRWQPAHTQIIFDYSGVSEPTEIALSNTNVLGGAPIGTVVGTLSLTTSPVTGAPVYVLIDNAGGRFAIDGDKLVVNGVLNHVTTPTLSIKVAANDVMPIPGEKTFTITVVNPAGSTINLSGPKTIAENSASGTVVGTFSATGVTGTPVFKMVNCTPEGWLAISGNNLVVFGPINYEAFTTIAIDVTATGLTAPPPGLHATFTINVINVADPT